MAIWTCDSCGGASRWCVDKAGDVWILCPVCSLQSELWPEEPIWDRGVYTYSEGDDRHYEGGALDPVNNSSSEEELPF